MATIKGGEKFQAAMAKMSKMLSKPATLRVGFLEAKRYPDGTPVGMVAAIQNYGAPGAGIPPRPFFSNMVKEKSPGWPAALAGALKANDNDVGRALNAMGVFIGDQLRDAIINTNDPPLSKITIMLRGMKSHDQGLVVTGRTVGEAAARVKAGKTDYGASQKVLDETSTLLHSVDHEVT